MGQINLDVQLYRAARGGRAAEIQPLLKKGANIEARYADGEIWPNVADDTKRTPLIAAAINGKTDVMQLLLKKGANIEAKDEAGINQVLEGIPDPVGTFYRYGLARSLLRRKADFHC